MFLILNDYLGAKFSHSSRETLAALLDARDFWQHERCTGIFKHVYGVILPHSHMFTSGNETRYTGTLWVTLSRHTVYSTLQCCLLALHDKSHSLLNALRSLKHGIKLELEGRVNILPAHFNAYFKMLFIILLEYRPWKLTSI